MRLAFLNLKLHRFYEHVSNKPGFMTLLTEIMFLRSFLTGPNSLTLSSALLTRQFMVQFDVLSKLITDVALSNDHLSCLSDFFQNTGDLIRN